MAGEPSCSQRIAPNTGSISLAAAAKAALIQPQPWHHLLSLSWLPHGSHPVMPRQPSPSRADSTAGTLFKTCNP